jgi:hypothetical protein
MDADGMPYFAQSKYYGWRKAGVPRLGFGSGLVPYNILGLGWFLGM